MRSPLQQQRLLRLAEEIEKRDRPLGIGLKHQCWAGVAIDMAKANGWGALPYFGLSFGELKQKIKLNNQQPPAARNATMASETRAMARH